MAEIDTCEGCLRPVVIDCKLWARYWCQCDSCGQTGPGRNTVEKAVKAWFSALTIARATLPAPPET